MLNPTLSDDADQLRRRVLEERRRPTCAANLARTSAGISNRGGGARAASPLRHFRSSAYLRLSSSRSSVAE